MINNNNNNNINNNKNLNIIKAKGNLRYMEKDNNISNQNQNPNNNNNHNQNLNSSINLNINFNNNSEFLDNKEKIQEAIESHLKSKDIDNDQFKELMVAYGKKYSNFEEKHIEDLINTRRIEVTNIMKGIGDIKHKIDYLDLKETYLDSFLSIGIFDQGATLMKVK
jgi:hypothetical protein